MCTGTYQLCQCAHPGPKEWEFCDKRTVLLKLAKEPCIDSHNNIAQHNADAQRRHDDVVDDRKTDFYCSQQCCDDEVQPREDKMKLIEEVEVEEQRETEEGGSEETEEYRRNQDRLNSARAFGESFA